jgi:hypothetical protein
MPKSINAYLAIDVLNEDGKLKCPPAIKPDWPEDDPTRLNVFICPDASKDESIQGLSTVLEMMRAGKYDDMFTIKNIPAMEKESIKRLHHIRDRHNQ